MSVARWALAGLLGCTLGGCAELPTIESGICGNGVVDSTEDCDSFAPGPAFECRPRGSIGECRLDCRARADGSRPACPAGWGCNTEGICRAATGGFEAPAEYTVSGAWSLGTGNFDGDRRDEIVSREPVDSIGRTRFTATYFDERGVLDESRPFPKQVFSPSAADLSGDGRSEMVFSDVRVGVLIGQSDRSWSPKAFNSYRVPGATLRLAPVSDDGVEDAFPVVPLTDVDGAPGFYVADTETGRLRLQAPISGELAELVGDPATGDLFDDPVTSPCWEVVLAFRDQHRFSITDVCTLDPNGRVVWRPVAGTTFVELEPSLPVDGAPQIVDLNGDGHLDVLLGAGGVPYAAYGDGSALGTATPFVLRDATGDRAIPLPLAAGSITDDGAVDFVFDDHVLVSRPATGGRTPEYTSPFGNLGARWTVAKIADLNGNGIPDVVAASSTGLNIDFLNGTGTEYLNSSYVPTQSPVGQLAVADLDGDLIQDLAFIEARAEGQGPRALMTAFGASAGTPETPTLIGRIERPIQLTAYSQGGLGNMALVSREARSDGDADALAILTGNPDRIPFAPLEVTTFSDDGSVEGYTVFALTIGAFSTPAPRDVMVLANDDLTGTDPWRFWILTELAGTETAITRLETRLPTRFEPSRVMGLDVAVNVAGAAADLDADGLDEGIWVMPADDQTRCGIAVVNPAWNEPVVTNLRVIDEPCPRAQVLPVDADGDGALDIALLTGAPGRPRKLLVLWNDGTGNIADALLMVVSGDDSPEQFTTLAATSQHAAGFAYVTSDTAVRLGSGASRTFSRTEIATGLAGGSGITTADVDGDGVTDLALAASGKLILLKAQLRTP